MKQDETQRKKVRRHPLLRRVCRVIGVLVAVGAVAYGALIGYVCYREVSVPKPVGYDSIIVLGAQVKPDGEPSVQLRWRLDKALEMYRAAPCAVVVCGAMAGQEPRPEGDVMRELMLADGAAATDLYVDSASTDTRQNMQNAKAILDGLGLHKPLVVTSDYHLPRALEIAGDAGFVNPQGAGSLCRPELQFWLQNHGREALAWVKYWLVKYVGLSL